MVTNDYALLPCCSYMRLTPLPIAITCFSRFLHSSLALRPVRFMSSYKTSVGDGVGGKGLTLTPTSGSFSRVVIWMHGLGDSAEGWEPAVRQFQLDNTKFVLPSAPPQPVTANNGFPMPAWYDVIDFTEDGPENGEEILVALDRIKKIVSNEIEQGVPASQIIVGGFSQGGAMAYTLCLRSNIKLGGCCVIATWVPMRKEYPKSLGTAATSIPIWHGHGDNDDMVPHTSAKRGADFLKPIGVSVQVEIFKTLGHNTSPGQIASASKFMRECFASKTAIA